FNLFTLLYTLDILLTNVCDTKGAQMTYIDPSFSWIHAVLLGEEQQFHDPCPICNYFLTGIISDKVNIAFHVTVQPDISSTTLSELQDPYHLPYLGQILDTYLQCCVNNSTGNTTLVAYLSHWHSIQFMLWNKFCLQLLSMYNGRTIVAKQSFLHLQAFFVHTSIVTPHLPNTTIHPDKVQ
ncbi:hypothetical protein PAXRUDRAFT_160001, partial [Paxillus rubicundulus Ve08.2h10]